MSWYSGELSRQPTSDESIESEIGVPGSIFVIGEPFSSAGLS